MTLPGAVQRVSVDLRRNGEELFPGIIGYGDTVIPEINLGLIAGHDLLFLGEKGQAKSRLMRLIARFLDPELPTWTFQAVQCMKTLIGPLPVPAARCWRS